jgi:carbonic anhydrase/acetyltransferase-like protein (isoleucine patch superfamily)
MALILEYMGRRPRIAADAYIAPNATIIGDVTIGAGASVWYGAVVRGDVGRIVIGPRANVQDNAVLHVNGRHATLIGADVTIGHGVVMEGCAIGDGVMVGMNATVLSGATVGAGALIAAGAVVRENAHIPEGVLVAGVPGVVKGMLDDEMKARLLQGAEHYERASANHRLNRVVVEEE